MIAVHVCSVYMCFTEALDTKLAQNEFLQQKVSVLIINMSTDAQKLASASRNKNTRSNFFIFIMVPQYLI